MSPAVVVTETRTITKIPKPPGLPLIGNLFDLDLKDPLKSLIAIGRQYGPIFILEIGGARETMVCNRELLNEICDESRFHKLVTGGIEKLRPLGGDGLFTAQHGNYSWEVAHRVLMPLFGPLKIRDMFCGMLDISEQLCLKWARLGPSATIDVANDFTRLTLDTLGLCAMGYRFNSFYNHERMHPFIESMAAALVDADKQSMLPDMIGSLRVRALAKFKKHIASMRALCQQLIVDRRQSPVPGNDLLNAMLSGTDPKTGARMTDESIIQNLITFLIAGHETTSGLLSFVFYYLLENSDVLLKAREEVDSVVGNDSLTVDHLSKLPYIDMILRETLRLMPTAPGFYVTPFKDEILGSQYPVSAGDTLFVFLHLIHRDPAVWGDDAEEFRPERMASEKMDNLPNNAWKPFGNGLRGCIGRAFAWQEAKLSIAIILQQFDLSKADPTYTLSISQSLTIKPKGFNMRVKLRNGKEPSSLFKSRKSWSDSQAVHTIPKLPVGVAGSKPISVFYGSNTGTCEALAQQLSMDCAAYGFASPTPLPLDLGTNKLTRDSPVIFIVASYDGMPSDNGQKFMQWVGDLAPGELQGIQFAVFGCGHRDWTQTLFKVPKMLDQCLSDAGAERLINMGTTDVSTGLMHADFDNWKDQILLPRLAERYDLEAPESQMQPHMGLQITIEERKLSVIPSGFASAEVVDNEVLTSPGAPKKNLLSLKLPLGLTYNAGDHLQVLPFNPRELVDRAMTLFHLTAETVLTINSNGPTHLPSETPIFATELLGSLVDLTQTISQRHLQQLAEHTIDIETRHKLHELAGESYDKVRSQRTPLLDVLLEYALIKLPLAAFLCMLPRMRPRTYSFASAPGWKPGYGKLLFSIVGPKEVAGVKGKRGGLATSYLAGLKPGDSVFVAHQPCKPELNATIAKPPSTNPIIMIAAGAGLAPFHGILQQRFLDTKRESFAYRSPCILFFGCRGAQIDDICRDSLDLYERAGVVSVHRAYSQQANASCEYVQHSIVKYRELVAELWASGAIVMICSGKKVSDDVLEVLCPILFAEDKRIGKVMENDAQTWRDTIPKERLVLEVFN